jgi:hypothetical protein
VVGARGWIFDPRQFFLAYIFGPQLSILVRNLSLGFGEKKKKRKKNEPWGLFLAALCTLPYGNSIC